MANMRGNFINKIICIVFAIVIFVSATLPKIDFVSTQAAGEDATITVSLDRNTLNVGDTFNVKVTYQSNIKSGYLTWELKYDNSIVGRDGSSGTIIETYWFDDQSDNTTNITKSYSFKAKAVGKASFSISATSYALNSEENDGEDIMSVLAIGASATIADVGSSDATLKELTVDGGTLVPAFSTGVTSYTVTVPYEISTLYLFPKTNDSRATHTIEGDEFLNVGTKTRTIVVTAQDGTVKKYVVTITRQPKPTATPSAKPTATQSVPTTAGNSSTTVVSPTPTATPTVTETPYDGTVTVDDKIYEIGNIEDDKIIPEGFEMTTIELFGEKYVGAKGISKGITILFLASDDYSGLFMYLEESNEFLRYVDIGVKSGIYSLMKLTEDNNKLDFEITQIQIGEEMVDAYEIPSETEFYIVRAMNWDGEINYYTYDVSEKTMQRYIDARLSVEGDDEANVKPESTPETNRKKSDDKESSMDPKLQNLLVLFAVIACGICLVVAAFLVYFALKERKTCKIMTTPEDTSNEV